MYDITFLINEEKLKENYENYSKFGSVCYTLKTNDDKILIKLLEKLSDREINYAINNFAHFKKIRKLNVETNRIFLINPVLSDKKIKLLYNKKIRKFTFDSLDSLLTFEKYANTKEVELTLRISINDYIDEFSYIGFKKEDIEKIIDKCIEKYKKVNISFYLPQSVDNNYFKCKNIISIISKYNLPIVYGGVCSFDKINFLKEYENKFYLEIGQNLLKDVFTGKIKIEKVYEDKIIIANGLYGGFLDKILYNKTFNFFIKNNNLDNGEKSILICGPTGDSLDIIGEIKINNHTFKKLKKSKYIFIKDIGSYFNVFTMNYNIDSKKKYKIIKGEMDEI